MVEGCEAYGQARTIMHQLNARHGTELTEDSPFFDALAYRVLIAQNLHCMHFRMQLVTVSILAFQTYGTVHLPY